MNITESIISAFMNLKQKHRLFVSEANFQASFTWELAQVFRDRPDVKIYREFPVRVYDSRWHTIYIDILVVADGQRFPIELKYKTNTHYYATRGFYLPAPTVDEIAIKTIVQFLNADLSVLLPATVDAIKHINIQNMPYAEKKNLIQSLVDKVIYSQEKLIFNLVPDTTKLQPFATENFINQKSDPMEFTVSDGRIVITVPIVLRKYVNTVFDKTKNGVLSITDNNHLILKAFTTA